MTAIRCDIVERKSGYVVYFEEHDDDRRTRVYRYSNSLRFTNAELRDYQLQMKKPERLMGVEVKIGPDRYAS